MKRNRKGKVPRPVRLVWIEDGERRERVFVSKYAGKEYRRMLNNWQENYTRNITHIFPLERIDYVEGIQERSEG